MWGSGCLEMIASVSAIMASLRSLEIPVHTLRDLYRLIEEGDVRVTRRIQEAGRAIGYVLAQVCNILNPKMIVIGGELSFAGESFLNQIRETINQFALPDCAADTTLRLSALGSSAPLRGAMAKAVSMVDLDVILQRFLTDESN